MLLATTFLLQYWFSLGNQSAPHFYSSLANLCSREVKYRVLLHQIFDVQFLPLSPTIWSPGYALAFVIEKTLAWNLIILCIKGCMFCFYSLEEDILCTWACPTPWFNKLAEGRSKAVIQYNTMNRLATSRPSAGWKLHKVRNSSFWLTWVLWVCHSHQHHSSFQYHVL